VDGPQDPAFVGRATELDRLAALARLAEARPAAALVIGEAGMGKSRLLAESVAALDVPRADVRGYEVARDVPFAAAGGLLRHLATVPDVGDRLRALLVGEGAVGKGLETLRVFESAFRCLAAGGPLVVVLDDIQWADGASLSLLLYLVAAAAPAGLPLLLLGASRPGPVATGFASGLGRSLEVGCFAEIGLPPLARDEGTELATRLNPELEPADAERLWRQAQGSPFWLQTLLAHDRPGATPAELIRRRLAGLDPDAAGLFALLVVAARPMPLRQACAVLRSPAELVRRSAAALVDRGLAVQEAASARIAHDLIREVAAADLPEAEQRRLHRVLADQIEADAGDDVRELFRALEHQQASGAADADLAIRIARSPQRRLLGSAGLATLGAIADGPAGGTDLQREVAALATELGEWRIAFQRWQSLSDDLSEPVERARAALAGAGAAFRLGRAADVHALVGSARKHAGAVPVVAVECDNHEVQAMLWLENLVDDAQPMVERATLEAQRLVDRAGGVAAAADDECGAFVRSQRGRLDAAIRRADSATVGACAELIRTSARDPLDALAAASDGVFSMLQFDGLPSAAEPRARRLLDEARERMLPSIEVEATHWVGWIAHHLGRLDEAAEHLERAVALAERVGPPRRFTLAQLRAVAHSIDASRVGWRGNVAAIEDAITAESDPHFRLVIRLLHVWLVGRFAALGPGELDPLLGPMGKDADRAGCGRCRWESVLHAAEAQARIGDTAGAEAALVLWDDTHPDPIGGPAARRAYVAALLTMHRDAASSLPMFARAASYASAVGYELMRLWIEIDAAVATARVDRPRGIEELRAVARKAQDMGAVSEQKLVVQQLRSLGVRTWKRGPGSTVSLTARELEVAGLVTAGHSNPEIAAALFLSRKTVERHVSNIFAKCGARNRTELADRLRDEHGRVSGQGHLDGGDHR
jgi:DNA-binding NarL/FixJ family response regulator